MEGGKYMDSKSTIFHRRRIQNTKPRKKNNQYKEKNQPDTMEKKKD